MRILLPYKSRTRVLCAAAEALAGRGHSCTLYAVGSTEQLRVEVAKGNYDCILSTECVLLAKIKNNSVPKYYLSPDFFCGEKMNGDCAYYFIPHSELSFDFIAGGARDSKIVPCGIPMAQAYKERFRREDARNALGIQGFPVFSVCTDGVSGNEVKATVRAMLAFYPAAQILLLSGESAKQKTWQSVFSDKENVFVLETEGNFPLAMSVADAVFIPAEPTFVCAAASREKILILLHSPSVRYRKNGAFLNNRGAAFLGKTAADNVSFAKRLLESRRLCAIMFAAQEKYIPDDCEKTLVQWIENH